MFGTYRTFLALAVVVHHLISIPVIGHYAVHGFFILSGYLMTLIMVNSYGYTLKGVRSFAVNRFLRLYPSYWVVLLLTFLAVIWLGEENSVQYRHLIFLPDSIISLAQNLSLMYLDLFPGSISPRLSPPTWALTIELLFYLLIALGISRSKRGATIWFLCSLIYMIMSHALNLSYIYRYSIVIAGTLPFSLGAMIFHYHKSINISFVKKSKSTFIVVLFILFVLNSGLGAIYNKIDLPGAIASISFYTNYIINALIILNLIDGKLPYISFKADSKIGDYSYPIYLMHWQAGFVASMVVWSSPIRGFNFEGIVSLVLALAICFCFSFAIIRYIDLPIEKFRRQIKAKANE